MAKEIVSATIETDTMNEVRRAMKEEKRPSQSNMLQVLLDEALKTRKKKKNEGK